MDPFPISQSELNASDVLFGRGSNSTTLVIDGKLVKKNEKFNRVISIFAVSSSNLLYIICIRLLFSYLYTMLLILFILMYIANLQRDRRQREEGDNESE